MTDSELHVAPALVRKAGKNATEVGARVGQAHKHLKGATPKIEKDFTGWRSATALAQCASAWETHINDLTDQVNYAAGNLLQSADNYDETEANLTAHINKILAELEAGQ